MKTMRMVAVALAVVAGCVASDVGNATEEAALTGSGSGSGSGTGSGVWHSTMNGGGAGVSWFDGLGASGYVNAYENGTGASRVASMFFNVQGPDPASQVCYTWTDPWWGTYTWCFYSVYISEWGWGTIPSADFTIGANASSARLHTTTDASFYTEKCTYGWYGGSGAFGCQSGVSESFDLAWNKDGAWSHSQNGTTTNTYGAYTQQTSGRLVERSATVTGTAAGHTVATGFGNAPGVGSILDTEGTTVSRDIVRANP